LVNLLEIGLFRHGATDWNIEGRLQGLTDTELNQVGRTQVQRAAERIRNHGWDSILTSPLLRARDSAAILATTLNLAQPAILDVVTERSFGIGEGLSYPEWFELQGRGESVAGAESDAEVDVRVARFLEGLTGSNGSKVLVVSHGGFIRRVLRSISDNSIPPADTRLQNASLQRITKSLGSWTLFEWNPKSLADD